MSSLIFGSVDIFGGEETPLPPPGGYAEEEIAPTSEHVPEPVRALATRVVSLLFAAGIQGDKVGMGPDDRFPSRMQVVVIGRRLDRIPASVLRLIGADSNGASVKIETVRDLTEDEVRHFHTWTPDNRARYGAGVTPGVVFTVGLLREPAQYGSIFDKAWGRETFERPRRHHR
jgi:hypothetical protein